MPKVILENHKPRMSGGSYCRGRSRRLLGRGTFNPELRVEEVEISAELWADPAVRRDIFHALKLPGGQWVPRFDFSDDPASESDKDARIAELEDLLEKERQNSAELELQLENLTADNPSPNPAPKRRGRPPKEK